MSTIIRPEISRKNKYWINKHRHYELKHFCLQYPEWKRAYYSSPSISSSMSNDPSRSSSYGDPTARHAMRKIHYIADKDLHNYILKGVTEGLSYTYLRTKLGIPCSRDMYYDRYRKFFWLLDNARD